MPEDTIQINVRKDLYEKAEKYIKEVGGFDSVNELVEFLLSEVLESESSGSGEYSEEDEEKVKERLRSLGYL
ncbi:MAG: CopG family transcriptional regulator [Desulfurococcales archaeon]|nr:CopG family transcriptional regulator [Desulfurococcales archaeon]